MAVVSTNTTVTPTATPAEATHVVAYCQGNTKEGNRCSRPVKVPDTLCHLHKNPKPAAAPKEASVLVTCQGQKKDGTACGNKIKAQRPTATSTRVVVLLLLLPSRPLFL